MTPEDIKAIRAGLGLTQAQFAEAMGSDISAVQRWEGGQRKPRGAALKLLEGLEAKANRRKDGKR